MVINRRVIALPTTSAGNIPERNVMWMLPLVVLPYHELVLFTKVMRHDVARVACCKKFQRVS